MAVNFPDNPVLNQEFSSSNRTWIWDGSVWLLKGTLSLAVEDLSDVLLTDLADGEALLYNSTTEKWENGQVDALPSQTGNSGKYLTTDGTTASWAVLEASATTVSETAPASPDTGDTWFKSSTGQYFVYYDSFWVEIGAGSSIEYLQYFYGISLNPSTGKLIIEYNNIDDSQPAIAVSDYVDWFITTHSQVQPLDFNISNGHLIMESA